MDLFTKAKYLGIQTEFIDGQGHRHVTDTAALKIILDALPVRVPYRFLEQAVVVRSGRASRTELRQAATLRVLRLSRRARSMIASSSGRRICLSVRTGCT
jgi:4-alpha-glucanotransferase